MFSLKMKSLCSVFICAFILKPCVSESLMQFEPTLHLYSPGDTEFAEVLVRREGEDLTLACELRGDEPPVLVWNYIPRTSSISERAYTIETNGSSGSRLIRHSLTEADSGRYVCSAPPLSRAKYVLVQPQQTRGAGPMCARGSFSCAKRCVLPLYVCDGLPDCAEGEDEAPSLCGVSPCARAGRLNCSGRCVPAAACCDAPHPLCRQPACCEQRPAYDPPPVDRRAPDDLGFIQSTIYTVTACALIFMIAVVLLVSALCKMHMKRAALRSYAHATRLDRLAHAQHHRFPPCYEASSLLHDPPSPVHQDDLCGGSPGTRSRRTRLAALTEVFTERYRQVPTQCTDVEMTSVPSPPLSSPARSCRGVCERPAAPAQPNRLTLQLGRFQLSIPRFGRTDPRPDTPNVAEINIDDLDFVRLNSNETYTLNGRTIRLLGGNFENYPPLSTTHPPPYNEVMRYKLYGPPPEYLSRDRLNRSNSVDEEARSNVEMPPGYDELAGNNDNGNNGNRHNGNWNNGNGSNGTSSYSLASNQNPIVIDRSLIIMSDIIGTVCNDGFNGYAEASCSTNNDNAGTSKCYPIVMSDSNDSTPTNGNINLITSHCNDSLGNNNNDNVAPLANNDGDVANNDGNVESLNSVIDNLPAIDSDVNANDNAVAAGC